MVSLKIKGNYYSIQRVLELFENFDMESDYEMFYRLLSGKSKTGEFALYTDRKSYVEVISKKNVGDSTDGYPVFLIKMEDFEDEYCDIQEDLKEACLEILEYARPESIIANVELELADYAIWAFTFTGGKDTGWSSQENLKPMPKKYNYATTCYECGTNFTLSTSEEVEEVICPVCGEDCEIECLHKKETPEEITCECSKKEIIEEKEEVKCEENKECKQEEPKNFTYVCSKCGKKISISEKMYKSLSNITKIRCKCGETLNLKEENKENPAPVKKCKRIRIVFDDKNDLFLEREEFFNNIAKIFELFE